jgi:hypothetical protein
MEREDYRGKIMDGEVLCLIAGWPSMLAYLLDGPVEQSTWGQIKNVYQ